MALSGEEKPLIGKDASIRPPSPSQSKEFPATSERQASKLTFVKTLPAYNQTEGLNPLRQVGILQASDLEPSPFLDGNATAGFKELIDIAPWRDAVTYRDTWPHEYVVIKKDGQQELLAEVCRRFCYGEGVDGRFFSMKNRYLFIGDYKYWLMPPCHEIDLEKGDYVLNRALIYRDRRDFLIRDGDDGRRNREIDTVFGISGQSAY